MTEINHIETEISLDQIVINQNAYFYKKKNNISKAKINQIFTEASKEKLSNRYSLKKVKVKSIIGDKSFEYSICIFRYNHKPGFLTEQVEGWQEVKFSFLLIVEYLEYVIVYKNNIAGTKTLWLHVEPIDYSIISRLFFDQETVLEKIYVSNMSTADNVLRNRSLEANNLQGSISRIGAAKQVIHNMRIANQDEKTSLSLSTSRINGLGDKQSLTKFFLWGIQVSDLIEGFEWRDTFIDNFARPIDFQEHIGSLEPLCILIKFDKLQDELERELIERIYLENDDGEASPIDIHGLIDSFKSTFDIRLENRKWYIDNPFDDNMTIKINTKSINVNSPEFKKIKILKVGSEFPTNLNSFINHRNDFIINFTEPKIIYTFRKLFEDHHLLADINGFLSVFQPLQALENVTSEKGSFTSTQTTFSQNSIFGVIESQLANDSNVLVCDDLNDEWADLIAVKNEAIVFYHAKYNGDHGLSASNLHEIIGQAHKNIGFLEPSDSMLDGKKNKWSRKYNNKNTRTQINRLRIAPNNSVTNAIEIYKEALLQPNIKKQVNLVIDFISKQQLSQKLQELADGRLGTSKPQITQILWFVSSLIANCKEMGIETYITCKP